MHGVWRWLCACVLAWTLVTQAAIPEVKVTHFPNMAAQIQYFEDSSVVIWHDAVDGIVYRSADEGKSWAPIKGPEQGQAHLFVLHPYDKTQAYILTRSTQHWRTSNRGETWQSFSTPHPPTTLKAMPLDFHPTHHDWILFTGQACTVNLFRKVCHDVAYYTTDGFISDAHLLVDRVEQCHWAKMTPQVAVPEALTQRVLCLAWDVPMSRKRRDTTQLKMFASDDLFQTRQAVVLEDLPNPRGFVNMGRSDQFLIAAVQSDDDELRLYVSRDAETWTRARFPHVVLSHENAYTILEGPKYHLAVDVYDHASRLDGLFISDSTGTNFSLSIADTVRGADGIIDYEHMTHMEGVAIVNVHATGSPARVQTRITHDEGASWTDIPAPTQDLDGKKTSCVRPGCSLHLHAVLAIRNLGHVFASTAPGIMMGVGSMGDRLRPYGECDTFISTDAGLSWRMVARGPHKHVFADQGGLLVMAADAPSIDVVQYSFDYGTTWTTLALPEAIEPVVLTSVPDGTALKILLLGGRRAKTAHERYASVFIDFAVLSKRKCAQADFERFYPATPHGSCVFGRRQWYLRRKAQADCFVRDKFHEPQGHDEACACTPADYECDMGFVRSANGTCQPTMPVPAPPGACTGNALTFRGPSGYRKVPGNTCVPPSVPLDAPVQRPCSEMAPATGSVRHAAFTFPASIAQVLHFASSPRILVRLTNGQVFQSADDGSTWHTLPLRVHHHPPSTALRIVQHPYDAQRAFVITQGTHVHYTMDGGRSWKWFSVPLQANGAGVEPMQFHPRHPSWVLWIGSPDCFKYACTTELWYATVEGYAKWSRVATHVRKCAFVETRDFPAEDERAIVCEKPQKQGFDIVVGDAFFTRRQRTVMRGVLGFSVFSQYMIVAQPVDMSLHMYVSMDARTFAPISLPHSLRLDHSAYTVLDSVTRAVFLHVTTQAAQWGDIIKSNSNGTYFASSLGRVNRDAHGFVDFEKMQGLDGIALANLVSNTHEASLSGRKALRTVITHNDGSLWKSIPAPPVDSSGRAYECQHVGCNLHLHNLLERPDHLLKPTSPSATGMMLATGNVGLALKPYSECDTFFTRDGGFTWQEMHRGTHKWEFGDHGAIILLADDTRLTDTVRYTLDQGLSWSTYRFAPAMRIQTIDTVPEDTKRQFVMLGETADARATAVFLDFSHVLTRPCVWDAHHDDRSDFERWSPSQQRAEACLFGQQTWLWRRKRDRICYVGEHMPQRSVEKTPCACSLAADFECEFNHYRDVSDGTCMPYLGAQLLPDDPDTQCARDAPDYDGFWYERTNMRKIPLSQCRGGERPDRGRRHRCRSSWRISSVIWWLFAWLCLGGMGYVACMWMAARRVHATSPISLGDAEPFLRDTYAHLQNGAQHGWHLVHIAWANVMAILHDLPITRDILRRYERPFSQYHMLSTDEDAEILRDDDDMAS